MDFDRTTKMIHASKRDWLFLGKIALLKGQIELPDLGLWRRLDDEFLWRKIVSQICNRGGIRWSAALQENGLRDAFDASVSANNLSRFSRRSILRHVEKQMAKFHVGRFREDNAKAVVANVASFVDAKGRLEELRNALNELDCTSEPIGPEVQAKERMARSFLMDRLIFYHKGQKINAKRKPPSDFLINVGFARTLIPFDSRMRQVFKETFGLSVSDASYEPIEDFFLEQVYPRLHVTPAHFDRILFNHYSELRS